MQRPSRPNGPRPPAPLPPALLLEGGDGACEAVLGELPDGVALPAWETLRAVRLWAATEPARRAGLFRAEAHERREAELLFGELDPELAGPLAVLLRRVGGAEEGVLPDDVAWPCMCACEWALAHAAPETALLFAETAALAAPENPGYAYVAGRLFRARCRHWKAERWLRRAAAVGWRTGAWEVHARSLNSLANLYTEQGSYARARELLDRALRAARRRRLRALEGEILHDLFVVAVATHDVRHADRYAQRSTELYGPHHPRLPKLAHDVAFFWITRGCFSRAAFVLEGLAPHFTQPDDRLRVIASAARAAGACGEAAAFDRFRLEAWTLVPRLETRATLASSLVDLGFGASCLSRWDQARESLEHGLAAARERGETDVVSRAEAALQAVERQAAAEENVRPARFTPDPRQRADRLAERLVEALRRRLHALGAVEGGPFEQPSRAGRA